MDTGRVDERMRVVLDSLSGMVSFLLNQLFLYFTHNLSSNSSILNRIRNATSLLDLFQNYRIEN